MQVDLCSQDHMWSNILRSKGGFVDLKNVTDKVVKVPALFFSLLSTLFPMRVPAITLFFFHPGVFWAQQLLRAASCSSSRPIELLSIAATVLLVPQLNQHQQLWHKACQLNPQSEEHQEAPSCYPRKGKEQPVSAIHFLSSDIAQLSTGQDDTV